jgi:hypothetical protein
MVRWRANRVRAEVEVREDAGQAVLLLVAAMAAVVVGAVLLGGIARGIGESGREQAAADLGALAGAQAMREAYSRLFEPPDYAGKTNPRHLEVGPYEGLGRDAALGVAFPDGATFAPTQIRVTVRDPATSDAGGHHYEAPIRAQAEAELAPPAQIAMPLGGGDGEYQGPFRSGTKGQPLARPWGYRSPPWLRRRRRDEDRDVSFARSTPRFSLGGFVARDLSCCARGRSAGSNSSGPTACVWHEARRRCGRVDGNDGPSQAASRHGPRRPGMGDIHDAHQLLRLTEPHAGAQ